MASKPSTNIPVLDLEEQLHTGANPSHNSSKPHHLQEIMTELLGSSQTHPTRCKHPGAPAARTSLCLFPRQGLQAQVTREGPKVSGVLDASGTRFASALVLQVSLCPAVEQGGHSWPYP